MTGSGTSGGGRLRIGGWVPQPDIPAGNAIPAGDAIPAGSGVVHGNGAARPEDHDHAAFDQPASDGAPDEAQQAWDRLAQADHPVPAADPAGGETAGGETAGGGTAAGDNQGGYRGRRRRNGRSGRAGTARRVATLALVAGLLLVGAGVVVRLLDSGPTTDPGTGPGAAGPAAGGGRGPELGSTTEPSPARSATPTPTGADQPVQPVQLVSHEAEAGEAGSHGQVASLDGASGGQVVRLSGNPNGTFVRFPDVVVAEPGQYELIVYYFCEQRRTGTVSVNNQEHLAVEFPSRGNGGGIGTVSVSATLAAGGNSIWIGTPGGAPLSLDRIALHR